MNVHVTDLQAHYKQVRNRLGIDKQPVKLPPIKARPIQIYDEPIGPVKVAIRDIIRLSSGPTFRSIRDAALAKHNITVEQFNGQQRHADIVRCRREVWFHTQKDTKLSLAQIGRFSGGRDHTTIMNGIARYQHVELGEHNPRIARKRVYELARYAANKDDNSRKRSGKKRRPAALVEG